MNDQEHRRKSLADDLEVDLDLSADQKDRDRQDPATEVNLVIVHANAATDHVVAVVTALEIAVQPRVTMKVVTKNRTLWRYSTCITKLTKMNSDGFSNDMERLRNVTL